MLINSKEQMLTEKLRSILKFGVFSTRYKDIFDIYFLSTFVDKNELLHCFQQLIYEDNGLRENDITDIVNRVTKTFKDRLYLSRLKTSQKNWIGEDLGTVLDGIVDFLRNIT